MKFGLIRFIQLLGVVMLAIFAARSHPRAETIHQTFGLAFAQNGPASSQGNAQEARPAATPPETLNKKPVVLSRHDGAIPSLAFSPDGKRLASAGDNSVKVTDLETGKELLNLKNSRGMHFFSVAYSPDGRILAGAQSMLKAKTSRRTGDTTVTTYVYFGEVLVWDAQSGVIKMRLNDDSNPAWALAFSPDGKWLAVATGPIPVEKDCKGLCPAFGEITLWETGNWKVVRRLRGSSAPIRALAISPDGQLIAGGAGLMDGGRGGSGEDDPTFEVFLWKVESGELQQKFKGHTNSITSLAFSPDSRLLASASRDRTLKLWDCRTYELKKMASDQMLSVEEMQTISDATSGKSDKKSMPPVSWLNAIRFSRDGKQVIGGSADSIIRYYESESLKLVGVLKPPGWPFLTPMMRGNDPMERGSVATADIDRMSPINRRGPGRGMPIGIHSSWPSHPGALNSIALSPDGKTLAIGNIDGKIRILPLK